LSFDFRGERKYCIEPQTGGVIAVAYRPINFDTLVVRLLDVFPQWTPELKRTQSAKYLLHHLLIGLARAGSGDVLGARVEVSQEALAADVDLSRGRTNQLLGRLKQTGWIESPAPGCYQAGEKLRELVSLLTQEAREKEYKR
jgi:hypothetical protein